MNTFYHSEEELDIKVKGLYYLLDLIDNTDDCYTCRHLIDSARVMLDEIKREANFA